MFLQDIRRMSRSTCKRIQKQNLNTEMLYVVLKINALGCSCFAFHSRYMIRTYNAHERKWQMPLLLKLDHNTIMQDASFRFNWSDLLSKLLDAEL